MGQLIGLAILFIVVAGVCSKLFGNKKPAAAMEYDAAQQQLQAAYRQGFADGVEHAQSQPAQIAPTKYPLVKEEAWTPLN